MKSAPESGSYRANRRSHNARNLCRACRLGPCPRGEFRCAGPFGRSEREQLERAKTRGRGACILHTGHCKGTLTRAALHLVMDSLTALDRAAAYYGIQPEYLDVRGRSVVPSERCLRLILQARGVPTGSDDEIEQHLEKVSVREWA